MPEIGARAAPEADGPPSRRDLHAARPGRSSVPPDTWRGEALMRDVWRIGMSNALIAGAGRSRPGRCRCPPAMSPTGCTGLPGCRTWPRRALRDRHVRARHHVDTWIRDAMAAFNGFAWRDGPDGRTRLWHWLRCSGQTLFERRPRARAARPAWPALLRQLRYLSERLRPDAAVDPRSALDGGSWLHGRRGFVFRTDLAWRSPARRIAGPAGRRSARRRSCRMAAMSAAAPSRRLLTCAAATCCSRWRKCCTRAGH